MRLSSEGVLSASPRHRLEHNRRSLSLSLPWIDPPYFLRVLPARKVSAPNQCNLIFFPSSVNPSGERYFFTARPSPGSTPNASPGRFYLYPVEPLKED